MTIIEVAYIAARGLWIPLALIAALWPAMRRRVMVPLAASAIAAGYEVYMSRAWSQAIRVDILLVLAALGFVDAFAGLGLWAGSRSRPDRKPLRLAAALCLVVPALAIAGLAGMLQSTATLDRNLDSARRFRFEAYFRDDETAKRVFGTLTPGKNPLAGYYVTTGNDDRFAHLVVNDEGRFWIYSKILNVSEGIGRPGSTGEFEGTGEGRDARMRMALRRQEGGAFLMEVHYNVIPNSPDRPVPMRKAEAPRFPRPLSPGDEVRFAGVFSATYGEMNGGFWVSQVWLWESRGKWWGQYLRDHYMHGNVREFISTEKIDPVCSEQCKVLSFQTSRGPVTLTRVSADEWNATQQGEFKEVRLSRGETVPGFFLDLAPVATRAENREWIEALTIATMITWTVP